MIAYICHLLQIIALCGQLSSAIFAGGGIAAVIEALRRHTRSPIVVEYCCLLFPRLVKASYTRSVAFTAAGGPELLIGILRQQAAAATASSSCADSSHIVVKVCRALDAMIGSDINKVRESLLVTRLLDAGVLPLTTAALQRFCSDGKAFAVLLDLIYVLHCGSATHEYRRAAVDAYPHMLHALTSCSSDWTMVNAVLRTLHYMYLTVDASFIALTAEATAPTLAVLDKHGTLPATALYYLIAVLDRLSQLPASHDAVAAAVVPRFVDYLRHGMSEDEAPIVTTNTSMLHYHLCGVLRNITASSDAARHVVSAGGVSPLAAVLRTWTAVIPSVTTLPRSAATVDGAFPRPAAGGGAADPPPASAAADTAVVPPDAVVACVDALVGRVSITCAPDDPVDGMAARARGALRNILAAAVADQCATAGASAAGGGDDFLSEEDRATIAKALGFASAGTALGAVEAAATE